MTARPDFPILLALCVALAGAAMAEAVEEGVSRPGATYETLPLGPEDGAPACAERCAAEESCRAWTFIRPGHPERGADQFGLCLLKDAVPEAVEDACCVSGVKGKPEGEEGAAAAPDPEAAPEPEAAPDPDAPGWVGLQIQDITPEIATSLDLRQSDGALVVSVTQGGPADRAGLRAGDLIVAVGGTAIADIRALVREVAARAPGDMTALTVLRAGEDLTLEIEIGARPN